MASLHEVNAGAVVPAWTAGDRLRKAREHAGYSQGALSELIDVSTRSIQKYEGDKYPPKRHVVVSWSLACGVPVQWLVDGSVPDSPPSGPRTTGEQASQDTGGKIAPVIELAGRRSRLAS